MCTKKHGRNVQDRYAVAVKKIWNGHCHEDWQECVRSSPVLTTLLAFIARHLLHFLVRKSDCLRGQTRR